MSQQLPLDGYIRVSRVGARRQGEGFISPEVQENAIRAWAEARGIPVEIQPPELNRSGGTMDRPIFNQILERIQRGESGGILVYKVDRFARSMLGALTVLSDIGQAGGSFASCSEQIDYVSSQGRAFLHMQFVFAELFREQIRESWATATGVAVEDGIHISPHIPYGYTRDEQRRYVPHPVEADIVREVFRRRAQRQGWNQLATWLNQEHPLPDRRWQAPRVQRIVASRVYLGEAFYGDRVNPDAHPALITGAQHAAAQAVKGRSLGAPGSNPLLLTGLVRCASCRYLMQKKADKRGRMRYVCKVNHVAGRCPDPSHAYADQLDAFMVAQFGHALAGSTFHGRRVTTAQATADLEELESAREELEAFALDLTARRLLGDRYHAALEARVHAVQELERKLARNDEAAAPSEGDGGSLLQTWADWPFESRRRALTEAVDVVFVRGKARTAVDASRVHVCWRGEGPDDLPTRGRKALQAVAPFAWPSLEGDVGVQIPEHLEDGAHGGAVS